MEFKSGMDWKVCYDEENERYTAEVGSIGSYHLYEITADIFNKVGTNGMSDSDSRSLISKNGRHLYMDINDRCGPPYTVEFDDNYRELCSWADIICTGKKWSEALTNAAIEIFPSEEPNRQYRKNKNNK